MLPNNYVSTIIRQHKVLHKAGAILNGSPLFKQCKHQGANLRDYIQRANEMLLQIYK